MWKALESPKLSKILSLKEYGRVRIKNDLQRQSFTKYLRLTHDYFPVKWRTGAKAY